MTQVLFTKTAAGPAFGPYLSGDVVDLNAGDLAKMTGATEPGQADNVHVPAAVQLTSAHPLYGKITKKGT